MDGGAGGHKVRLEKAQGGLLGPVDLLRGTHTIPSNTFMFMLTSRLRLCCCTYYS
jgi:hypothetical protein